MLLLILILILIFGVPGSLYANRRGGPVWGGGIGVIVVILIILLLTGHLGRFGGF